MTAQNRISRDWDLLPLGEIAWIQRGKFSARPRNDPKYYGGKVPFIQTGDVRNSGGRITSHSQTLNERGLRVSKLFPAETLYMTIAANIGDLGIAQFASACPDSLVAVIPRGGNAKGWLYYALSAMKPELESIATQNAQANLNLEKLVPFLLRVPPRSEQLAMTAILDDVTESIRALGRVIAKKLAIKQGILQQLLTGRIRLSGFKEPWATSRLADVTHRIGSGITPRGGSAVYAQTGRPFVRSQNVGWGELRLDDLAFIDEATHFTFPATEIRTGDVLLNITGASIGRAAVATPALDGGNVNQHVCEIRVDTSRMNSDFVSAVLNSSIGQRQIDAYQAGGNRQGLNFQQVGSVLVPSVSLSDQTAIAHVINDIDRDLRMLQLRLAKARDIKTGMMQELLTGRTRLPVESEP